MNTLSLPYSSQHLDVFQFYFQQTKATGGIFRVILKGYFQGSFELKSNQWQIQGRDDHSSSGQL